MMTPLARASGVWLSMHVRSGYHIEQRYATGGLGGCWARLGQDNGTLD